MLQDFSPSGGAQDGRRALPLLRTAMRAAHIDALYIPHEDEYDNEYLPAAHDRLAWATGFTGSFGSAFVGMDEAVLFVDGRYTLQGREQTDPDLFDIAYHPDPGAFGWIAGRDLEGKTVGYDPMLLSLDSEAELLRAVARAGGEAKALDANPIDAAWGADRPAPPKAPVRPYDEELAGETHSEKRRRVGEAIAQEGADAALVTAPPSLAWLFNMRGGDVERTPLPLGRALLRADGTATLFMDPDKASPELRAHLGNEVALEPETEDALREAFEGMRGQAVILDPAGAPAAFAAVLEAAGARVVRAADPVALPKAVKNARELETTREVHRHDGAAVTRFLHWLDTEAQGGSDTEIDAALKLEAFRRALTGTRLEDLSFPTISGAGANGALPHYRVTTASNAVLARGSLYLVDSGGQYPGGTTDVTRTVPIGKASDAMRRHYTLVLQGHIRLATARFPAGTTGTHLDVLARDALWRAGHDYQHGTGHGVGVYLGVHEGPQKISKYWNAVPLEGGMIVSNEPGYYKEGAYGIRIENLEEITAPSDVPGGDVPMLGLKPLTMAPLSRALIETAMLSEDERRWTDAYHAKVREALSPLLAEEADAGVRLWLEAACAPLEG